MQRKKPDFRNTTRETYSVASEILYTPSGGAAKPTAAKNERQKETPKRDVKNGRQNGMPKLDAKNGRQKETPKMEKIAYGQSSNNGEWERRTARLVLRLPPSLLVFVNSLAAKNGTTANETVNRILNERKQLIN